MWARVVVAVILLACVSESHQSFEAQIETFQPKGLRIGIEDVPDVTFVAFHVSINRYLHTRESGQFHKELLHPVNGRWSYELPDLIVNKGDKIYYRIFVIKNRIGYTTTRRYLERKELKDRPCNQTPPQYASTTAEFVITPGVITTEVLKESVEGLILDVSKTVQSLQHEASALREANNQLATLLESIPEAKKLTMSGRIPPDGEPTFTVGFILREKLNLRPNLVSAVRHGTSSIVFTVSTIAEKIEILKAAENKLKNTRITIS